MTECDSDKIPCIKVCLKTHSLFEYLKTFLSTHVV